VNAAAAAPRRGHQPPAAPPADRLNHVWVYDFVFDTCADELIHILWPSALGGRGGFRFET